VVVTEKGERRERGERVEGIRGRVTGWERRKTLFC
jgi:hypothetical protein